LPNDGKRRQQQRSNTERKQERRSPIEQLRLLLSRSEPRRLHSISEDHVLSILAMRRARDVIFGPGLFSDPGWDILLELYAAELGGRRLSLAEIARAIDTPQSTTARWIVELEKRGLVTTADDPANGLRVFAALSPDGRCRMKQLTDSWTCGFMSI
jgi:DNA-binding MarR family transcriptional regulator